MHAAHPPMHSFHFKRFGNNHRQLLLLGVSLRSQDGFDRDLVSFSSYNQHQHLSPLPNNTTSAYFLALFLATMTRKQSYNSCRRHPTEHNHTSPSTCTELSSVIDRGHLRRRRGSLSRKWRACVRATLLTRCLHHTIK